jgi:endonuclease/exonuclease/phosphatase family metal-dependent hydrolase
MKKFYFFLLFILFLLSNCQNSNTLRVATFNIRNSNADDGINSWSNRKELVLDFINQQELTIIGLQEVLPEQLNYLRQNLPDYDFVNAGRIDGKRQGESNPVFYKTKHYRLLQKDTFWLSKTPQIPGSKSWNAACPRIVTWLKLRNKETGNSFFVFNTHFDHFSQKARELSASLLIHQIKKIAATAPFIVLGDFNCTTSSQTYKLLTKKWNKLPRLMPIINKSGKNLKGPKYTYNGFSKKIDKQIIDHIFLSTNVINKSAKIHKIKKDGIYISDHYPLTAKIKLSNKKGTFPKNGEELSLPLYPPYIKNQRTIFTNNIKVELRAFPNQDRIHYTLNNSTPDKSSPLYEEPISINKTCLLKARSYQNGDSSKVMQQNFYKSILDSSKNLSEIMLNTPVSPEYFDQGIVSLIDKKRGLIQNPEKGWLGFRKNNFDVVLDFTEVIEIHKITLSFLVDPSLRGFKPAKITVLSSNNSLRYNKLYSKKFNNKRIKAAKRFTHTISLSNTQTGYVRIIANNIGQCPDWHPSQGKDAWLFVDEIIVE